ncbi:MAG TPA: hypothetical protein PK152_14475 [Anaerolineales bacterium]|nr:hypothetical protein [Anaerolineales bacterium]HRK90339.1 hypothetical protein [Anaerolineales bacterium]
MKSGSLHTLLHLFGALFMAVLPAFMLAQRPLISHRKMHSVHERLDAYGKRK